VSNLSENLPFSCHVYANDYAVNFAVCRVFSFVLILGGKPNCANRSLHTAAVYQTQNIQGDFFLFSL